MTEQLNGNCVEDRESIARQIDKKSGLPKEEKGLWILEDEIRLWNSPEGEKGKDVYLLACLFFSIFLSLSHIKCFFYFSFTPRTDDYTANNSVSTL